MRPSFSIIIPLYNKEREISRTLESVLFQRYPHFEAIVVDDGSTDNGVITVEDFAKKDERISIIRKENGGVCSARNVGIRAAKNNYIALLDADDSWDPDFLSETVKMIEDFPECGMWGMNFAETSGGVLVQELPTGLQKGFRGIVENYFGMSGRVSDLYCSSSVVIRKEVFEKVGYFDERLRYSEDIDQWWRIIANYPVAFYDKYLAFYHYDASGRAMHRKRKLCDWLPYYPEKYASYKGNEPFYSFSQRWCAINLREIYFNDAEQREKAATAAEKLDFSVLPSKYRIMFGKSKVAGMAVYILSSASQLLKKLIKC